MFYKIFLYIYFMFYYMYYYMYNKRLLDSDIDENEYNDL